MSFVATAIVGSSAIGAIASSSSAKSASKEARKGAERSADATVQAAQLQIDELARQFDFQMDVLMPQITRQFNAQSAFHDLLGITASDPMAGYTGKSRADEYAEREAEAANMERQRQEELSWANGRRWQAERNAYWDQQVRQLWDRPYEIDDFYESSGTFGAPSGTFAGGGGSATAPGARNAAFRDPNLDPRRLSESSAYAQNVTQNRLAGADPDADAIVRNVAENQLAPLADDLIDRTNTVRNAAVNLSDDEALNYAMDTTLRGRQERLAGGELEDDPRFRRADDVRLAAATAGEDPYLQNVRDTNFIGEDFRTSPGYNFAVEEMGRELDRRNSAGGNYGGRAIMEAQRRAKGLADQEYYNWADRRYAELGREDRAMERWLSQRDADVARGDAATNAFASEQAGFRRDDVARDTDLMLADAARGDQAIYNWLQRRGTDIARGDAATGRAIDLGAADVGRGDAAIADWMRRRELDTGRLDDAGRHLDALAEYDLRRGDQGYYNYLASLGTAAGFGNPASQAVSASQAQGGQNASVYGQQGNQLAAIYGNLGRTEAGIELDRGANLNNAAQSGIQNWMTWKLIGS